MLRRLGLSILYVIAAFAAGSAPASAKRVALIIANGNYANATVLKNPPSDGRLIAASLKKAGFETVDLKLDLPKAGLDAALQAFSDKAQGADVALIYYAGHGIEAGGQNYLIPTDARLARDRDLEIEATRLDTLLLMGEGAKLRIVVLDACRNNPFVNSMQRTLRNRAIGRGLAAVEPEGETLVVYAAKAGATAADGEGMNSPFAEALAKRLPERGVEISLLFRAVRDDVLAKTGRTQEPFTYGSLSGQAFYFVPPGPQQQVATVGAGTVQTVAVPSVSRETTDALYWQGTLAANTEQGFRDYLARFPQGAFADVARQNLQRFAKPKVVPSPAPKVLTAQPRPAPAPIPSGGGGSISTSLGIGNFAAMLGSTAGAPQGSGGRLRDFAFSPSPTIRRQITTKFVSDIRSGNELIGNIFQTMTGSQDVFALMAPEYAKYGMSVNNLADSLGFFLSALASAAQGDESDSPIHQVKAAQAQMVAALSLDASVQKMSLEQRQTISDNLVLYTLFVATLYQTSKAAGPQALREFQNQIADLSKSSLGIDARNLRLTDQGFQMNGQ